MKFVTKPILLATICFCAFTHSQALVTATLTPSTTTVNANSSFTLTLNLSASQGEQLTSVGYRLSISAPGSGLFSIIGRDITGSLFTDTTSTNGQITSTGDSALPSGADNLLNTENDRDLGSSVADPFTPTDGPGPFFVNTLTISSTATSGTYTISLFTGANVGFGDPLNPDSQSISANSSFTVVPEPSTYALMALGTLMIGGICLKRKSAKI